jgi:ribose/xylose/arabinose/galactoside ABC-type transport system permease subunit
MASVTSDVQAKAARQSAQLNALRLVSRLWAWLFLLILIAFFSIAPGFFTIRSFQNIGINASETLIVALGQTFVIIAGGIDLSVGFIMGLVSVVAAVIMRAMNEAGYPQGIILVVGILAGLIAGFIPGLINGLVIAKLKAPPFIATLGMLGIAKCVAFLLSGGQTVGRQPDIVRLLGNNYFVYTAPDQPATFFHPPPGADLRNVLGIMTLPLLIMVITAIVAHFVLSRTRFGQHTYALGGSKDASIRAGINVDRHTIKLYIVCALLAALGGLVWTARFNSGSPIAGEALMLNSVAAVVIGGASLFGGEGNVLGTVVGSFIMAVLYTGLVMLNVPPFWQFGAVGVIIIIAVLVDQAQADLLRK